MITRNAAPTHAAVLLGDAARTSTVAANSTSIPGATTHVVLDMCDFS